MRFSLPIVFMTLSAIFGHAAQGATFEDVEFSPMKADAREREIVLAKVPKASKLKDGEVETAIVAVNNTGKGQIFVRLKSKDTCESNGKHCETILLYPGEKDWIPVFDRHADNIELGKPGFGTMRAIVVDKGFEVWTWTGYDYHWNLAETGTPVQMKPAPQSAVGMLASQFGPDVRRIVDKKPGSLKVSVAAVDLNGKGADKADHLLVRLSGPGICGRVIGCPIKILEAQSQGYKTILDGFGLDTGQIVVLQIARGGWRDLATDIPNGHAVFGWAGTKYGVAEQFRDLGEQ